MIWEVIYLWRSAGQVMTVKIWLTDLIRNDYDPTCSEVWNTL